jgi:catechol 2,3-dioxygenase-like lactoylglutathione lyase family enzyme
MTVSLNHVQLNVSDRARSLPFYRDFFGYFGYRTIADGPDFTGVSNGSTDFWIFETAPEYRDRPFHRKRPGVNHLAFGVDRRADVDAFCRDFLGPRGILALYDSPRDYPEYAPGYYAVFFEDPDRLKLEIVHRPAFSRDRSA